jgi:ferredoxin
MTFHLQLPDLQALLDRLRGQYDRILGPRVLDGVVQFRPVAGVSDLPAGYSVTQTPGHYRLTRDAADPRIFNWVNGPESLKGILFPSSTELLRMRRTDDGNTSCSVPRPEKSLALIGARPCDVAAMLIQDRVFLRGSQIDSWYRVQRDNLFIIAVNCVTSADNCFCTSMGSGPAAQSGFDIALTEVLVDGRHFFTAVPGSARGEDMLRSVNVQAADATDVVAAKDAVDRCAATMKRSFNKETVRDRLLQGLTGPGWEKMAETCLACGNCTQVCPTCFCATVVDSSSLDGHDTGRTRKWDSCFSADHSYIHGGSIRKSLTSRYRQWISHKLATWYQQFQTPGCTGCGRCVTWCPVGIDLVANATSFQPEYMQESHENHQ